MAILVTGGAGFIGSHLTDSLIAKKHRVIVLDDLSSGFKKNINAQAKFYQLDIQNKKLKNIFKKEKPKIVYHLAAQINVRRSIQDPIFDAQKNILGSLNLLENCIKYAVKKFIFISTGGAIYGDGVKVPTQENALKRPTSPYGIAKLSIEKYLHYYNNQYNFRYTVLRLANVYGPRQNWEGEAGVVAIFLNNLKNKKPLKIFGGKQTRDFVYVSDVVNACIKVLNQKKTAIYNIGTGEETTVNQLAKKILKISNKKNTIKHLPYIKGEQLKNCLSFAKIKQELQWQPQYDLNRGLEATMDYFKK
ncbi:UDP-glucose 4-epimerase [Candidatus Kuenenbacteria bacterium CG11_big_fil_rev_8_21_14_0_20_37_9]|uniref:UDP-glucose 4-epimerase n=2 Tax=Candidatus Kueneniibacteriota TaxID=1752740 RepID=A0A2M6XSW0_9BACT|nr:MAG: hypothetical protein AUJ29_03275 [Candidatus Kuenenbacteria bacterium CG1_02_38_13]PIR05554.1 MAG: UDP-glucose 4-epimerase [Candidatus Kuenenbacteria bacterium CG11_big_fil_rev_8_21_14_0_20_37_9]PIU10659.1 MAG: UDP-glucose 4-epimerase [Candidatus Kuenenbacteria bacterium CG08_land_8_20_14_0_20_37_23]